MSDCLFCKIISGEIKSERIFEDENMIIIKDINPQAKIHYLMIPKMHIKDLTEITVENSKVIGLCLAKVAELAKTTLDLKDGFRVVTNIGEYGCQSVPHIHFHILGGEQLSGKMS